VVILIVGVGPGAVATPHQSFDDESADAEA